MGTEAQTSKYGVTAVPGGIFFEIRPREKGRSLVLLAPRGLEQSHRLGRWILCALAQTLRLHDTQSFPTVH